MMSLTLNEIKGLDAVFAARGLPNAASRGWLPSFVRSFTGEASPVSDTVCAGYYLDFQAWPEFLDGHAEGPEVWDTGEVVFRRSDNGSPIGYLLFVDPIQRSLMLEVYLFASEMTVGQVQQNTFELVPSTHSSGCVEKKNGGHGK